MSQKEDSQDSNDRRYYTHATTGPGGSGGQPPSMAGTVVGRINFGPQPGNPGHPNMIAPGGGMSPLTHGVASVWGGSPNIARPEWNDNAGFISGVIDWAMMNLSPGQSTAGVRMPNHERYTVTRYIKPKQNIGEFKATLDLPCGYHVVMTQTEIVVYPSSNQTRIRDCLERYEPFQVDGKKQWRLVERLERRTYDHPECPLTMSAWLSNISNFFMDAMDSDTLLGTWELLSAEQLTGFPRDVTMGCQVRLFDRAREIGERLDVYLRPEGENANPTYPSLETLDQMFEMIWLINQTLPSRWRYTSIGWAKEAVRVWKTSKLSTLGHYRLKDIIVIIDRILDKHPESKLPH